MTPQERHPKPPEPRKINPSIFPGAHHQYNPKREANTQNRDETTGLDDEDLDEDIDDETDHDDEFGNQSGAV